MVDYYKTTTTTKFCGSQTGLLNEGGVDQAMARESSGKEKTGLYPEIWCASQAHRFGRTGFVTLGNWMSQTFWSISISTTGSSLSFRVVQNKAMRRVSGESKEHGQSVEDSNLRPGNSSWKIPVFKSTSLKLKVRVFFVLMSNSTQQGHSWQERGVDDII